MGCIPVPAAIRHCWIHGWGHQPSTHAHPHRLTQHRSPHFSSLNSHHSVPNSCIPHIRISQLSDPLDRAPSDATRSCQRCGGNQRRFLILSGLVLPFWDRPHYSSHHPPGSRHPNRTYPGCNFSVVPRILHPSSRSNAASHGSDVTSRGLCRH